MFLEFEKWHGCKNDFIVVWLPDTDGEIVLESIARQTPSLCDRSGAGVGADGVLVLHTARRDDLTPDRLTIINSDGSRAANCGNGLRCAALSVLKRHREKGNPRDLPEAVEFSVSGRGITCSFMTGNTGLGATSRLPFVAVNMGVPTVGERVSFVAGAAEEVLAHGKALGIGSIAKLRADDIGVCTIGNPHVVIPVERATRDDLRAVGPVLQKSAHWDGINVHLVHSEDVTPQDQKLAKDSIGHTIGERFRAFVWERGAGETQACGTGACAIAAVALASGLSERSEWVAVDMPGGRLYVHQPDEDGDITLAGPGQLVFSGRIEV